jgi:predicted GNAT family acetyltransferase
VTSDVAARVSRGLCAVWERQATYIEGGTVVRGDGILTALTNLPDQTLNVALVEDEPRDAARALAAAGTTFERHGLRLALDMEQGRHPEVERAAEDLGLRPVATRPAMAVPMEVMTSRSEPAGLSIQLVEDDDDLAAAVQTQVEVFGIDPEVAERFVPRASLTTPGFRLYLARLGPASVGSAAAHLDHGAVGIFGVATVPWARRRGVGTALTARTVQDARDEADLAWLQATPEGQPIYERMGFESVSDWVVWVAGP